MNCLYKHVFFKYNDKDNVNEKKIDNSTLPILFPSFFASIPYFAKNG